MKKILSVFLIIFLLASLMSGCGCKHEWEDATCEAPETCENCGKTRGETGSHKWKDATCAKPKTCKYCDKTKGKPLGHDWQDGKCTRCKKTQTTVTPIPDTNVETPDTDSEEAVATEPVAVPTTKPAVAPTTTPATVPVTAPIRPAFAAMPNVVGKTETNAKTALENQGLGLQIIVEQVYDAAVAVGVVVESVPGRGEKLQTGDTVILKVSKGAEMKIMPVVYDLTLADAKELLIANGFTSTPIINYIASSRAAGTVLIQSPTAGHEYTADVEITLEVSNGSLAPQLVKKTVIIDLKGYALENRCMVSVKRDGVEVLAMSVPRGTEFVELYDQEGLGTVYYTILIDDSEGWVHTEEFS